MSATAILSVLATPVTKLVTAWLDRKKSKDSLKNKAAMAKQTDTTNITLTDAEWETIAQQNQDATWKDEFVTLVVMYPFMGLFAGTTYLSFSGDARFLDGTLAGIQSLQTLGVDVGWLMNIVVMAAVGLKIWRKS
jgi:hypothetical protein